MPAYTFYPCKPDGVSTSFATFELGSDDDVREQARLVMEDHASCAYVEAWQGERRVLTIRRPAEAQQPGHPPLTAGGAG